MFSGELFDRPQFVDYCLQQPSRIQPGLSCHILMSTVALVLDVRTVPEHYPVSALGQLFSVQISFVLWLRIYSLQHSRLLIQHMLTESQLLPIVITDMQVSGRLQKGAECTSQAHW